MRILFMGTPQFAAVCLERLITERFELLGVVTQPDRPKGRGMTVQPCEVKCLALQNHLPVWQPERVATPEFLELFTQLQPDLVVVVAFGQKIPNEILYNPKYGCINVHGSLLPEYRGAAPIQWSILNGDAVTGVTTMYMDEGWDTGDLIYQETTPIDPDENFACLYLRLAHLGADLLVKTIKDIEAGIAPRIPQDDSKATFAPKLPDGIQKIDWNNSATKIHNLIRVLAPTPGGETNFQNERLKIITTQIRESEGIENASPGMIIKIIKNEGILVGTADYPLLITKLQPAGKKVMTANDYANGRRLQPGMIFGEAL
ncbi:MAG TPA: methionyl-tRNA formyltransferase [Bacillota bacterium]|nr:methionyl-tRNA formyltransferase [Bacillota bacterium]HPO98163.1 methionyl-tRNA formyltransferase [Bacillota bacterium]